MEPTISILGGDLRQVYLARLLLEDGRDVTAWGLEQGGAPRSVSLDRALEGDILLLPLPVCRGDRLNLPLTDTELELRRLWPRLRYDQLLLGGMTGNLGPRLMADYGLTLVDYYAREETQVANAAPTAEGAIQLAMESTDRTILGSRCLIIGYGRIGRLLADRLLALGAEVTVSALGPGVGLPEPPDGRAGWAAGAVRSDFQHGARPHSGWGAAEGDAGGLRDHRPGLRARRGGPGGGAAAGPPPDFRPRPAGEGGSPHRRRRHSGQRVPYIGRTR